MTDPNPADDQAPKRSQRSEVSNTSNRRRFILGVGAATALLAGCVGNGDDTADGNGTDPNGDDANGDDDPNGADDNGNGGANGDDANGNGDDANGADDPNGDDANGADDPNGDDANGDDDPNGNGDLTGEDFFRQIQFSDNYRFEFTAEFGQGEGRFNGGNFAMLGEYDGMTVESYFIDGTVYSVFDGQCLTFEGDPDEEPPEAPEDEADFDDAEITYIGPDTIDGDAVEAYELSYPDGSQETATYYLLSSGYMRRIESEMYRVDFYDWNQVDPIEPPDMDCQGFDFPGDDVPDDFPDDFEF